MIDMAVMMGALYRALVAAKVSEEVARAAAEEQAHFDVRFTRIEGELTVIKWMIGTLVAITLGNLWLSFNILARLAK